MFPRLFMILVCFVLVCANLEKLSPLSVFTHWVWQRKPFPSYPVQRVWVTLWWFLQAVLLLVSGAWVSRWVGLAVGSTGPGLLPGSTGAGIVPVSVGDSLEPRSAWQVCCQSQGRWTWDLDSCRWAWILNLWEPTRHWLLLG